MLNKTLNRNFQQYSKMKPQRYLLLENANGTDLTSTTISLYLLNTRQVYLVYICDGSLNNNGKKQIYVFE